MGIFLFDTTSSPGLSLKEWVGRSKNNILIIPFLKGKTFACTQGENCNKSGLFLWEPWEGIVSAAPAQDNSLRSRRLEVVGTRKTGTRERDTPSCAPVLSCLKEALILQSCQLPLQMTYFTPSATLATRA